MARIHIAYACHRVNADGTVTCFKASQRREREMTLEEARQWLRNSRDDNPPRSNVEIALDEIETAGRLASMSYHSFRDEPDVFWCVSSLYTIEEDCTQHHSWVRIETRWARRTHSRPSGTAPTCCPSLTRRGAMSC